MILLTNDDGIFAEGIVTLKRRLSLKWDVFVVAPDREKSASSHALTLHRPLRMNKIDENSYSVDGTPTDCVMLAMYAILKQKPEMIISGLNHGPNLGDDIIYSGTVAAAMEGALLGIPSIAVSVASSREISFDFAADFTADLTEKVLCERRPSQVFLNINLPNLEREKIKGVKITRLGKRVYNDIVIEKTDPRGKPYYWIGGEAVWEEDEKSDYWAVANGMISVTPIHLDLTDYGTIPILERWDWGK